MEATLVLYEIDEVYRAGALIRRSWVEEFTGSHEELSEYLNKLNEECEDKVILHQIIIH